MIDIPSADEVRSIKNAAVLASNEQIAKFLEFTFDALTNTILGHVSELQSGKAINFHFPDVPDGGLFSAMWKNHHEVLINTLRRKGYWCKRHPHQLGIVLEIALKDQDQVKL